jgi:hypothetical protein
VVSAPFDAQPQQFSLMPQQLLRRVEHRVQLMNPRSADGVQLAQAPYGRCGVLYAQFDFDFGHAFFRALKA